MDSENPSKTIVRQQRHQWELSYITLDAVFKAKGTDHLKEILEREIYDNEMYQRLPKFRQLALQAYFQGVCDTVARIAGVEVPPVRIKTVPPKKTRKVKIKAPVTYNPPVKQTPLPAWAAHPAPVHETAPTEPPPPVLSQRVLSVRRRSMTMVPPAPVASELGM